MSPHNITLSILFCITTVTLAEVKMDFLKIGSKEFKSVSLSLEAGDQVKIVHETGISRIQASELPSDIQLKVGWQSEEQKLAANKALLEAEYPMASIVISNKTFSDNRVRDELNRFLDSNPDGKVFALAIEVTENPNLRQFIKIIFDKEKGMLLHLRRSVPLFGNSADYDLVKWIDMNRETLSKGIPWMDDNFKPLGKSEKGKAPLNLGWTCYNRPEIPEWP